MDNFWAGFGTGVLFIFILAAIMTQLAGDKLPDKLLDKCCSQSSTVSEYKKCLGN